MSNAKSMAAVVVALGREEYSLPKRFPDGEEECSLIEYLLDSLWTVADEIQIVFHKEPSLELVEALSPFAAKITIRQEESVIQMLATGFGSCRSEYCLAVRENIPFLKPSLVFALFKAAEGQDAAIPRWLSGKVELFPAVYRRKALLNAINQSKKAANPIDLIDDLYSVRYVDVEKELKPLDPDLQSFFLVEDATKLDEARSFAGLRTKG